jgi:hypothetical protein
MKSTMDQALDYLWDQIRWGFEYPDAHTNACEQFKLTPAQGKKLQKKYDSCH